MTIATDDLALALELTLLDAIDLEQRGGPGTPLNRVDALIRRHTCPGARRFATACIATKWIGERLHAQGGKRLMQSTLRELALQYGVRGPRMTQIAEDTWVDIGK